MKHYILFLLTILSASSLFAQPGHVGSHKQYDQLPQAGSEDAYYGAELPPDTARAIYTYIELMPRFRGSMKKYVQENFHYPPQLNDSFIYARVVVRFVIDTLGNVTNAEVIRHVHPAIDSEVLRLVRAMPPWLPARQNGEAVPITYTLPFSIDSECRCVLTRGME